MKGQIVALLSAVCLMGICSSALAADTGGEVLGQVKDASEAVISGATVTVVHAKKGVSRSAVTNENGEYSFRNLPVGNYSLTVEGNDYRSVESQLSVNVGYPLVIANVLQSSSSKSIEELVVLGTTIQGLNMAETTAGMIFDDSLMDVLPVENGFESMILMTAGTVDNGADDGGVTGSGVFNNANAIGGGSSAENAFYLNGVNITQIESGLGTLRLPWEVIQQTNVQTGGMTADFGGALGGIVNAVSKSGSNEFDYGIEYKIEPSSLRAKSPTVRRNSDPSVFHRNHRQDSRSFEEYNVWASGPIVKDKAFFYLLLNPQEEEYASANNATFASTKRKSNRWFTNLEWYINDNHSVGLTAFSTERDRTTRNFNYNADSNSVAEFTGNSFNEDGGTFLGLNYHGELSDNFSVDFVYGNTEEETIPKPANDLVRVDDCRVVNGNCSIFSTHSDTNIIPTEFSREQIRLDFKWSLGNHDVSFGLDQYDTDVFVNSRPNGASSIDFDDVVTDNTADPIGAWLYGLGGAGSVGTRALDAGVAQGQEFIRRRVRNRFSDSTVSSRGFYVQDNWQFNEVLNLNLGVRYSDFENTVSSGEAYADMDGNIAPRLGVTWDLNGEGRTKIFGTLGRYFQPVASRMNITQGSSSIEYYDYYTNPNPGNRTLQADGSPERGNRIVDRQYTQTGFIDPNLIASKNLEAMFSDQISLGFSRELENGLQFGVRGTFNELKRSVEDTDYGPVLVNKLRELGINDAIGQSSFYVLANPGKDIQLAFDFDQDGTVDEVTLTTADHLIPKAERKYLSLDFTLGGQLTDRFYFNSSYTWAKNYGNTEGLVKTTNGQADPGWTSDYDYGDALDNAYGNLPNDRRHSLKFNGSYDLTENFILGFAVRAATGRPKNRFSPHPQGVDSCAPDSPWRACISRFYIEGFYDKDGNPSPRGSAGSLSTTKNVDLSLSYRNEEFFGGVLLKLTAFNVFNFDEAVDITETDGVDYELGDYFQSPRRISLTARMNF